jgi:hypothetical protein
MCVERDHLDPDQVGARVQTAGAVRHLAYHVYPVSPAWLWNLDQLRRRMGLFNGLRLVAAATGPETATADQVRSELAGLDVEVVEVPNSNVLREMQTYPMLLSRLERYHGSADVTFYGHAKGVTSESWAPAARRWSSAMYEALLDHWPAVQRELFGHCSVGIFRRHWRHAHAGRSNWHYSGSFRWTRNTDLYARAWQEMEVNWTGSETHPGMLFNLLESSCLYGEFHSRDIGLYKDHDWNLWAEAARQKWLSEHTADRRLPALHTVILTAARQAELVHEAIRSVLDQTVPDWQLLIMDAGELSAAGVYERYAGDARISVLPTGETAELRANVGIQAWAINEAFRRGRVRGSLVSCLCDDDLLDPGWLQTVTAAAELHPDQAAWYGAAERRVRLQNGMEQIIGWLNVVGVGRADFPLRGKVDGMQVALRRAAWVDWPQQRELSAEADGHWMDQVAARHPIHPLDAIAGVHRHTPLSTFTKEVP